jgi:cytidylate kinase
VKIAIDGPVGAGKTTVARMLAKKLNMTYIDTGAMYRAVALAVAGRGLDCRDEAAVRGVLGGISLEVSHDAATGAQLIRLDGADVSEAIRAPEISIGASEVSKFRDVRLRMVELQRAIARGSDVVMDGRDIGTYVFPDADIKFFLTASAEMRAARRHAELLAKGAGVSYEECLKDLKYRDENDSKRELAPLRAADDAIVVDTGGMSADEVAGALCGHVAKAREKRRG